MNIVFLIRFSARFLLAGLFSGGDWIAGGVDVIFFSVVSCCRLYSRLSRGCIRLDVISCMIEHANTHVYTYSENSALSPSVKMNRIVSETGISERSMHSLYKQVSSHYFRFIHVYYSRYI